MVGEIVDVLSYIREEIRPDNLGKFYVNYYAKLGPGIANFLDAGEKSSRSEERRVGKECRSRWSPYH